MGNVSTARGAATGLGEADPMIAMGMTPAGSAHLRGARSSSGVQLLVIAMTECLHEFAELAFSCRSLCAVPTGIP